MAKEDKSEWYAKMREYYGQSPLHGFIGLELTDVGPGTVMVTLNAKPESRNLMGMVHGTILMGTIDSAVMQAVRTNCGPGDHISTLELKTNFLAPAKGNRFLCKGEVVRVGGTIGVAQAMVTAEDGEIVASGMGTIFIKRAK